MNLQQAIDEETLNAALNLQLSGGGGGDIGIVSVKGDATSSVNASHHLDTTDTNFVVHASITSGVKYAGPTNGAITLSTDAVALATNYPDEFRARCGDGFVAAIGKGADLYLLLHGFDLSSDDKIQLSLDVKASAGVADVFNANGSSNLSTTLERLSNQHKLDISFVQQGGVIALIPTNLKDAQTKVASLAQEEVNKDIEKDDGPRSIFIQLVPYSDLPNWPGYFRLDTTDVRQKAARYRQRLSSILYEILNIRENYYRDRSDLSAKDTYFYDYYHGLRSENLNSIEDSVRAMLGTVSDLLTQLNSPECNPKPIAGAVNAGRASPRLRAELTYARNTKLQSLGTAASQCDDLLKKLVSQTNDFDDFDFWIQLPLPLNAITPDAVAIIENPQNPPARRIQVFAQNLYRQWVEEPNQIRCRLFSECLSSTDKSAVYTKITTPLSPLAATSTSTTFKVCDGEFDVSLAAPNGCQPGTIRFDCGNTNEDADATQICENQRGAFRHTYVRTSTRDGNHCGYWDDTVTCYFASPQLP